MEKATAILARLALPSEGLALFRRGLGLLCLLDACLRLPTAVFWLTDLGVLPRSLYFRLFEDSLSWSIFSISGRPEFAIFLLLLMAVLGAFQLAGRSNKWVRVGLWILALSVQNRNPGVLEVSDYLLRLLLFWDMFLPQAPPSRGDYVSAATVGLQLQLSVAAGALAWHLTEPGWRQAAVWSLGSRAFALPWLWMVLKVFLILFVVAAWVRTFRIVLLVCAVPVLTAWGVVGSPYLPVTLMVAALALYAHPGREAAPEVERASRPVFATVLLACLLVVAQVIPGISESARYPGAALGLEQPWTQTYPSEDELVVELQARGPGSDEVLWAVDVDSDRRSRLWAQKLGVDQTWASRLTDALQYKLELQGMPAVWMETSVVRNDQTLGPVELQLLTDTPVRGDTRRRVQP